MEVRGARPDDFEEVGALLVRAYESVWGPTGWEHYRTELLDVAGRAAACEILVAVSDGVIVGTVTVVPPESPMRTIAQAGGLEVRMLAVDPSRQRCGIATLLLDECVARAKAGGSAELVLQSDEDLVNAHRLYAKHGFRRRTDLDSNIDGTYRALGYALDLEPPAG